MCRIFNSRGHSSLLPSGDFIPHRHTWSCKKKKKKRINLSCNHELLFTALQISNKFKPTLDVLPTGRPVCLVSSNSLQQQQQAACLVVAVVSVIQEQLLRCLWTLWSFLPGACHRLTRACVSAFSWPEGEGFYSKDPPPHTPHASTNLPLKQHWFLL